MRAESFAALKSEATAVAVGSCPASVAETRATDSGEEKKEDEEGEEEGATGGSLCAPMPTARAAKPASTRRPESVRRAWPKLGPPIREEGGGRGGGGTRGEKKNSVGNNGVLGDLW